MTLSGMSAILDPLQLAVSQVTPEDCSRHCESDDERQQDLLTAQVEKRSAVLHWSTEQVKTWLQENVPFSHDRMQERLRVFENKGVDGLCLLTLQRTHRACLAMTDFEWLLFKAARKRLLSGGDKMDPLSSERSDWKSNLSTSFWTPPCTPRKTDSDITPPFSPQPLRSNSSNVLRRAQGTLMLSSPRKLFSFPKLTWSPDTTAKDEQIELLVTEVQSLRGEVVSAEEREATLQAQMHHLDDVLRASVLAGYFYTRTRWMPLLGEPMIDDTDVDDWLQRFLVLQGSSIFFYLRATDLRPQGTILLDDIVEAGPLPAHMQYRGDSQRWFSFHITTCHGLRLECSTQIKFQMDSWLTSLAVDFEAGTSLQETHKSWNGSNVLF